MLPDLRGVPEEAVQGQEWAWFGARGGCGHGMHPRCWMMYMTHSAGGSRHGVGAHGRLHVQRPTCRRAVTGERDHEHSPSGARVALSIGGEQFERLIVLGSEPGDPPVYILRVPCIAFLEHVNREEGRLMGSAHGVGRDRDIPRASSRSSAPAIPTPACSPPRPQGGRAAPVPRAARGPAADEGRLAGWGESGLDGDRGSEPVGGRGDDDGGG